MIDLHQPCNGLSRLARERHSTNPRENIMSKDSKPTKKKATVSKDSKLMKKGTVSDDSKPAVKTAASDDSKPTETTVVSKDRNPVENDAVFDERKPTEKTIKSNDIKSIGKFAEG